MWLLGRKGRADEANAALEQAREHLRNISERTEEVENLATSLRVLRERNHFAEQLQAVMGGP